MPDDPERLQQRVEALERELAALKLGATRRGVRKRSRISVCGLPLYDIAVGPDVETNKVRGYARGIVAIGDIATGVLAIGGVALGAVALGGCSIGILFSIGGLAMGGVAFGGAAIGVLAVGGAAVGVVAIGGAAVGYYACGSSALGQYVISSTERHPEAIRFFGQWIPGIEQLIPPRRN